MRSYLRAMVLAVAAAASTSVSLNVDAASFSAEELRRVQAYEGPTLPSDQVAVVFATAGRATRESTSICAVDGIPMERDGVCASVVYVRPGPHRLKLRYRSDQQFGSGTLTVDAAANRTYQATFSSLISGYSATVRAIPVPEGIKLTWRRLASELVAGDPRIDEEVPYAANSTPGEPVVRPPLTDTDRANLARLMSCAGTFSMDMQIRRLDRQEFASGYKTMNAFVQAALPYVSEDDALEARQQAVRAAALTYAPAKVAVDAATAESRQARAQLKTDVQACIDFYSSHAVDRAIQTQGPAAPRASVAKP